MRIDRLDLIAFGPFTGLSLDFSAPGLHVVYGPNEAGKSTALRAVRDALFGIPGQSPDNHTHDYKALRIGMTVSGGPGDAARSLTFRRRKGNKNTLLGLDGDDAETPLPDDGLAPFLGGTTAAAFERLHGLRLAELSEGSETLLAGGGEVGQLLFAAAGGLSHLRRVREELRKEAADLFLGRGRKPVINEELRALKEIRQATTGRVLEPNDWAARSAAIDDLRGARDALKAEARAKRAEAARARRLRSARGTADRLAGLTARRGELEAIAERDAPLRAAAERLRALEKRAAATAAAAEDREPLGRRAEAAEAAAARALAALAPAGAAADWSPPDLSDPQRAHLAAAADRHGELSRTLSEAVSKRRLAAERAADLTEKLAGRAAGGEAAADALSEALDAAAALPDPAAAARRADREAARLDARIAAGLAKLRGFDGGAAALAAFPTPPDETVDRFAADRRQAVAAVEQAAAALARCDAEVEEVRADLAALAAGGTVPTDADLLSARAERDAAWARIAARLTGDAAETGSPAELVARQERLAAAADGVADSLRAEAERVERAAALDADLARRRTRARSARARLTQAEEALAEQDAAWAAEWPGLSVPPHPPAEMRSWLTTAGAVVADHAARLDLEERRAEDAAAADGVADELAERLAAVEAALANDSTVDPAPVPSDLSLDALRDRAVKARKALLARVGQRGLLVADRERSEAVRLEAAAAETDARAGLEAWEQDWARATAPLGLTIGPANDGADADPDADENGASRLPDPSAVRAFLNGWNTVQSHRGEAAEFRHRLAEIGAAVTRFAADAAALAADLAPHLDPPLPDDPEPAAAVRALSERLAAADAREAERRELPGRIRELRDDSDAQRAGEDAATFLAAAREGNPDELAALADALEAEADDLDVRRDRAIEAVRDAEAELAALDTRGEAAESEQQAQSLLAKLDDDADRYARLALADALLAVAAERHRARHQGPVLAKAGALFQRLTGGSFAGLDVSLEGGDEPALVGVRPARRTEDGETPGDRLLPAAMSDGSRDALYLSLRLAGLAETAAGRPIPPLVVDDALERFDDARTAAALAALAELADPRVALNDGSGGTVQVILFTHHGRVAELAAALPPGRATVHRLPADHLPGIAPDPPVPAEPRPRPIRRAAGKKKPTAAETSRQKALL